MGIAFICEKIKYFYHNVNKFHNVCGNVTIDCKYFAVH